MRQQNNLDGVAKRVRNQMEERATLNVGDIIIAGRKAEAVLKIDRGWLLVTDVVGNQRLLNGRGVHKASELEAQLFKVGEWSEKPPAQVVAWMRGHPDDPRVDQLKEVWRLVAEKFEAQGKFNWAGAVCYFRNKGKKMGIDMPPELMGMKAPGKPKDIPKANEQIEDWVKENQVSKRTISKYMGQRAELERQIAEAQRGLAGLKEVEVKIMPMLKEMKGQQMKVKDLILRYDKTPRTTYNYEKAFQMALENISDNERDFVKGYILGQLQSENITEQMQLEKKQSKVLTYKEKKAGRFMSWLKGVAGKIMNWLSSYRRNIVMLEKVIE
jgi:hypothetical protein